MSDKFDELVSHIRGLMVCESRACAHISTNMAPGPERRARLKLHQERYRTYQQLLATATIIASPETADAV